MDSRIPEDNRSTLRYDRKLRVLIVGGGVAGLTLAALLEQRGLEPTVVEQAPSYGDVGYVIVLWPSGSKILKGLGLYKDLLEVGIKFSKYNIRNDNNQILHSYSIDPVTEKYGPIISAYRPDLINTLRKAVSMDNIKMGVTVSQIEQDSNEAIVTFDNGNEQTYDLVVGCDGIRSRIRRMIFGDLPLNYSGMTGWGFWIKRNFTPPGQIIEYWGRGKFFGIWPTKGRLSVFTSVEAAPHTPDPPENRIQRIREQFNEFGGFVPEILKELDDPYEVFSDDYNDLRMHKWHKGRVILIGDAAHPILPHGGGGAAMAMESASVLAEELCRVNPRHITQALENFTKRRKKRVNKIQSQSRLITGLLLVNNKLLSSIRNFAFRFYSNRLFLRSWEKILSEPL